jgi:hypothetical protein
VKQTRAAALSRQHSPPFVCLSAAERIKLRQLPHQARCLFEEFVGLSNFDTGAVKTSRPVLLALLDFDQVPCKHAPPKATAKSLRTAIDQLWVAGLLRGNRKRIENANKAEKCLFFWVESRKRIIASAVALGRPKGQGSTEVKQATLGPTLGPGVQNPKSLSPTSLSYARPVDNKPTITQRQMQSRMKSNGARHHQNLSPPGG